MRGISLGLTACCGLVGPCSNFVGSEEQVAVTYDDLTSLDGLAWDLGKAHDRRLEETDRLIGFCLLIRREVLDQIGTLDERFGVGCFEDNDFCLRADWCAVVARDAFVHHYGGRTFVGSGLDLGTVLRENERKFLAKRAPERPERGPLSERLDEVATATHRLQIFETPHGLAVIVPVR